MIELIALLFGLALLIVLPVLLLAAVFNFALWLLMLPIRALGVVFAVFGKLLGGLCSAVFSVVGVLAVLLIGLLMVVAFPLALIALIGMSVVGLFRWVGGFSAGATT